jgi:hypothetical protein
MNPIEWVKVRMLPKKKVEQHESLVVVHQPPVVTSKKKPKKSTKAKKTKKPTVKTSPKKKAKGTTKKRRESFKKHLEKMNKDRPSMIEGYFKDLTGELCIKSTKPRESMTREEEMSFQSEALQFLLSGEYKKLMKNLKPGEFAPMHK